MPDSDYTIFLSVVMPWLGRGTWKTTCPWPIIASRLSRVLSSRRRCYGLTSENKNVNSGSPLRRHQKGLRVVARARRTFPLFHTSTTLFLFHFAVFTVMRGRALQTDHGLVGKKYSNVALVVIHYDTLHGIKWLVVVPDAYCHSRLDLMHYRRAIIGVSCSLNPSLESFLSN